MCFKRKPNIIPLLPIVIFLTAPALSGAATLSWDFNDPNRPTGWGGEGVQASGVREGTLQLAGDRQFQLISPPGLKIQTKNNPYLRIRFRPRSPRLMRILWQPDTGKAVPVPDIVQIPFDRNFHTRWIELSQAREYREIIDRIALLFDGNPGWVEIDFIEIRPFSLSLYLSDQWGEFMLPRHLTLGTINSLQSPLLLGRSFVSWLNNLVLIIVLIGLILYFKSSRKKMKTVAVVGLALLSVWILYDLWETYAQLGIAGDIYRNYVKPPAEDKTFPSLGDFYRMVDFAENAIPPDASYHFYRGWPFDCRLKYYLYPRRINCDSSSNIVPGAPITYHLIYQNPEITYEPSSHRLIYREGKKKFPISAPGRIESRMDGGTSVFKETARQ